MKNQISIGRIAIDKITGKERKIISIIMNGKDEIIIFESTPPATPFVKSKDFDKYYTIKP